MNERIKELIKQSKMSLWEPPDSASLVSQVTHPENYAIFSDEFLEKFAELIVRECAKIAFQNDIAKFTRDGYRIGLDIQKHFGVEE